MDDGLHREPLHPPTPRPDWFADRPQIERQIAGALKSAIDAHGPVTRDNVASAAKRVYSALKAARGSLDEYDAKLRATDAYQQALDQADEELVKLPLRYRVPLYFRGASACCLWVERRAAQILAEKAARA